MTVFYAFVHGPEWEDIEYFCAENHALDRLRQLRRGVVIRYVSHDNVTIIKEQVYSIDDEGIIIVE